MYRKRVIYWICVFGDSHTGQAFSDNLQRQCDATVSGVEGVEGGGEQGRGVPGTASMKMELFVIINRDEEDFKGGLKGWREEEREKERTREIITYQWCPSNRKY